MHKHKNVFNIIKWEKMKKKVIKFLIKDFLDQQFLEVKDFNALHDNLNTESK